VVGHGNAGRATLFVKEAGAISSRAAFNAAIRPLPEFQREPSFEF
jgi:protein-L-isoaspartate(D-aspartate) O-methyltransferase